MGRLLTDATSSKIVPVGTQWVDTHRGQKLIRQIDAKIVDSKLITEPISDLIIPWQNLDVPSVQPIREAHFVLDLTAQGATGLLAGYADVDTWYYQLIRNDSAHHLSNGQMSGISLYKALRRLADAHFSSEAGENTSISTALDIKMTQVFTSHPSSQNAE